MSKIYTGCATALITPFKNGQIDYDAYSALLEQQLNGGIAALVVCGTTGEASTMSEKEQYDLVDYTLKIVDGYIPIIVGTGGNNTAEVIKKAKHYSSIGVSAQLCVTPYYNKTTQKGLIAHYTAIADSTDLPIILYNVPGRTGLNMLPQTIDKLADHPNIVGLKEACSDMHQFSETMRVIANRIDVYSGVDELLLPMLSLGAIGAISVVSNAYPELMCRLINSFMQGDILSSRQIQLDILPFVDAIFKQTSPSPIKAVLNKLNICQEDVRLPLIKLDEEEKNYLYASMKKEWC